MKNIYPSKAFMNYEKNQSLYLKLDYCLFIQFLGAKGESATIYFKSLEVTNIFLLEAVEEFKFDNKLKSNEITVKLVGPKELVNKAKTLYEKRVLQIKSLLRRSYFEVQYWSDSSRLRVSKEGFSKEEESENVKKNEPILVKNTISESQKIRIMIIDDSKTIQSLLSKIFSRSPRFEVVAVADRPSKVEKLIKNHQPDLITLDIHMPEMDGVTLLKKVINKYHIPTIVVSSLSKAEGSLVLDALHHGAVDYIQKPDMNHIQEKSKELVQMAISASTVNMRALSDVENTTNSKVNYGAGIDQNSLIVMGSSTGGTQAIQKILSRLPSNIPPILIAQHIPAVFSNALATRLNSLCSFVVKEGEVDEEVLANHVYIAPGGQQMGIKRKANRFYLDINDDEPVNRFKPSVDYLFHSVDKNYESTNAMAIILTGMGRDGSKGMLKLHEKGFQTIAQDEESCVVFGMPKEAINLGAVDHICSLGSIPEKIVELLSTTKKKQA